MDSLRFVYYPGFSSEKIKNIVDGCGLGGVCDNLVTTSMKDRVAMADLFFYCLLYSMVFWNEA